MHKFLTMYEKILLLKWKIKYYILRYLETNDSRVKELFVSVTFATSSQPFFYIHEITVSSHLIFTTSLTQPPLCLSPKLTRHYPLHHNFRSVDISALQRCFEYRFHIVHCSIFLMTFGKRVADLEERFSVIRRLMILWLGDF